MPGLTPPADAAPHVVVMGVSGCGKSTLGAALADALQAGFVEGDALHPPANVQRMAAGVPLTDADRQGWLQALAQAMADAGRAQRRLVLACSALKRAYRDRLRTGGPGLRLVHLHGPAPLLAERLAARRGHYMPAALLQSQLDTLEPPGPDEAAVIIDIALPMPVQLQQALAGLALPAETGRAA